MKKFIKLNISEAVLQKKATNIEIFVAFIFNIF